MKTNAIIQAQRRNSTQNFPEKCIPWLDIEVVCYFYKNIFWNKYYSDQMNIILSTSQFNAILFLFARTIVHLSDGLLLFRKVRLIIYNYYWGNSCVFELRTENLYVCCKYWLTIKENVHLPSMKIGREVS